MSERWRCITGHEGHYEVSDHGRVRSLFVRKFYGVFARVKILSACRATGGYRVVTLYSHRNRTHRVHRLVLEAFRGPCPKGCEASHLDGDPGNNRLENLVWETSLLNNRRKHGHRTCVLTVEGPVPQGVLYAALPD